MKEIEGHLAFYPNRVDAIEVTPGSIFSTVMAGHSRPKDGVASLACVPAMTAECEARPAARIGFLRYTRGSQSM